MLTLNKRLAIILLAVGTILLIPLIAMLFTKEVNWTLGDFIVGGGLLLGTGLLVEFVLRKVSSSNSRTLVVAILILLLLTWAELAVGIFDTPFAGS